ncbi:MFS transporter [Calothrix sp. FACHB-1219]|uniref:MFS transporter n=1 Tax=unclassified Calothrix TaxID=2619626 RepID=UPI0016863668|nr:MULTISPECIES: MFS transporter [unclassified Calothrix]MBD2202777.1 MFS transporter [Calothrix sp. FACHB-168]MBD2218930.1 MFS transporter [Calothrix sp. FACHB-1219]
MKYVNQLVELIRELRTFTLFWLGQSLSEIGTRLTGFGLSIWVYQNTHAVAQLSLVLFFTTLPGVLITPFVGALVDKWNRKWTIIFSEIGASLVTLSLALLLLTDNLQLWHTYVAAFFTSVCGSFQMTAKAAALPMMVPSNQMGRANGLILFSSAVGQLAAPVLAGLIIVNFQLQGLLLIDFCSYFIGLVTLLIIDIPQPEPSVLSTRGLTAIIKDIIYGWENISSRLFLMIIMAFMSINSFVNGMITVLINPLILSFSTATTFGSVMSIAGCGMAAGSMFMSIWGGGKKYLSSLFIFAALNGLGLIIAGIKPSIPIITLGITISFFTLPIILSINNTIWQNSLNPSVQGRALGLFYTVTGLAAAFGNLGASPLTDKILEPMLEPDGILANSIGKLIETGSGRGIGFLMIIAGLLMLVVSISLYSYFAWNNINEVTNPEVIINNQEIINDL